MSRFKKKEEQRSQTNHLPPLGGTVPVERWIDLTLFLGGPQLIGTITIATHNPWPSGATHQNGLKENICRIEPLGL